MRFLLAAALCGAPLASFAGPCGLYEAVEPGDDLATIAHRCDVELETLQRLNPGLSDLTPAQIVVLGAVAEDVPSAGGGWAAIMGDYAPGGRCIGTDLIVSIDFDRISIGETACTIAARHQGNGQIGLELTACNAEGEPVANRSALLAWQPGEITLTLPDRAITAQRCTDM